MMRTTVSLEDTDIKKMLDQIIEHDNKEDLVNLLTGVICDSNLTVEWFTKCFIGTNLPEVYPEGTIVTIDLNELNYGVNRKATKDSHLHIGNNLIVGKVQSFKGFNNYSPYLILAKYINTDNIEVEDVIHVNYYAVLKLEEF
jgi:hypothetical protein